jgi:hypothetical protein
MLRNLAFVVSCAVFQVFCITASVRAAEFGTAEEAKPVRSRPGYHPRIALLLPD